MARVIQNWEINLKTGESPDKSRDSCIILNTGIRLQSQTYRTPTESFLCWKWCYKKSASTKFHGQMNQHSEETVDTYYF